MREAGSSRAKHGAVKAHWRLMALAAVFAAAGLAASAGLRPARAAHEPLFVGFYDGWDPNARKGLEQRLPELDVFAPMWLTVRDATGQVVFESDDGAEQLLADRRASPRVFPLVSNAHDNVWDRAAAEAVILNPVAQKTFAAQLLDLARKRGFSGFIVDFENLSPQAAAAYPAMLAAVRKALSASHVEVWVTVLPIGDESLAPFAEATDSVVVMAYDECWASSNPGPIAGRDWVGQSLAQRLEGVDPRRVVVALASYGYDWPEGGVAKPVGVAEAEALAARYGAVVRRDPASGSPNFAYVDAQGRRHAVWFLDAEAFADQRQAAAAFRPRGYALWRLGLEDPAIWTLPHAPRPVRAAPPRPSGAPLPHPCDPLALHPAK